MSRLPTVSDTDANAAEVFSEIKAERGYVSNALRSLAHSPEALRHFARLGAHIKYRSALTERQRELVIICAAKEFEYEWKHHAPLALQAGVTPDQLDEIKEGRIPASLPAAEQALVRLVLEMFQPGSAGEETFRRLEAHWSAQQITDLVFSATYYHALGLIATALGVQMESHDVLQGEQAWQKERVDAEQRATGLK